MAFDSVASNLVSKDVDGEYDVFVASNYFVEEVPPSTLNLIPRATKVIAVPNPSVVGPNFGHVTFVGLEGYTTIKIYTINGDLIRILSTDGQAEIIWDLKTRNNSHITGGVYLWIASNQAGKNQLGRVVIVR